MAGLESSNQYVFEHRPRDHVHMSQLLMVLMLAAPPAMSGFQAMDANHDGKVTRDEHSAAARKMFVAMDANKNHKVTAAEMDAAHAKVTGQKAKPGDRTSAQKITVIDTNADGILTAEEHAAGSRSMFDAMDTDKDGALSEAELSAGHAKMLKK
jgi:Ca2+-binding EF-hand superfamily protein